MNWQNFWHWLYVAGMAIGAIHFILLGRNPRGVPKYEYLVATFIPIWSGLAYLSMTLPGTDLEQGKIEVAVDSRQAENALLSTIAYASIK